MRKNIISVILVLFMMLTLFPSTAYAGRTGGSGGHASTTFLPDTSVGLNFDIEDSKSMDSYGTIGDGYWEWYHKGSEWCTENGYDTAVLIINDIVFTGNDLSASKADAYGLRVPLNTTIIVRGVNTFKGGNATGEGSASEGILAENPVNDHDTLYITGEGTLNAIGQNGENSYGIFVVTTGTKASALSINCGKDFENSSLQINATSGKATNRSWAIRCYYSNFNLDNKNATITTNCIEQDSTETSTVGIESFYSANFQDGKVIISNCKVGIDVCTFLRFSGAYVDITAKGCAVQSYTNAEVKGGTVIAKAGVFSFYSSDGDVIVDNGMVESESEYLFYSVKGNVIINGGTLLKSDSTNYIYAKNSVLINGGNAVYNGFSSDPVNDQNGDRVNVYAVDWVIPDDVKTFDASKAYVVSNGTAFNYGLEDVTPILINGKSTIRMYLPVGTARFTYDGKFYYATVKSNSVSKLTISTPGLEIADYQYGGVCSTPSLTNFNETIKSVKYYCSTKEYYQQHGSAPEWNGTDSKALNAGTYYMYAVVDYTDSVNSNNKTVYEVVTEGVEFDVTKANQTALPKIQTIIGQTDTTFQFVSEPTYEYAATNSLNEPKKWNDFGFESKLINITGCNPATKYYLHYRLKGTENYLPSERRFISVYTAYSKPLKSDLTLNYLTEKISFDSAVFELFSDAEGKNSITSGASLTQYISDYGSAAKTLYIRKKSTSDFNDSGVVVYIYDEHRAKECFYVPESEMTPVVVSPRPQAPSAISAADIITTESTLTVMSNLLNAGNEYAFTPASQTEAPSEGWKSASEISISDLPHTSAFTLWQRVKAVESAPSSAYIKTQVYTSIPVSDKSDTGKTDTGITDTGKTDSGITDSGKTDSEKTDFGITDSEKFGDYGPHTGDNSDIMLFIILFFITTGVLVFIKGKAYFLKQHKKG